MRRATVTRVARTPTTVDFYPRSPCGERPNHIKFNTSQRVFLSTLSLRRATKEVEYEDENGVISIHALLAESDLFLILLLFGLKISIHALLAESDRRQFPRQSPEKSFLSTLSLRRATRNRHSTRYISSHFYPRSPCGERPTINRHTASRTPYFYPRSPCGERRVSNWTATWNLSFLSTLSLRRATMFARILTHHARNFYPRSPCGERHPARPTANTEATFLSTLSLRRATRANSLANAPPQFLSTLSLRRATVNEIPYQRQIDHFYPRSPCGERL